MNLGKNIVESYAGPAKLDDLPVGAYAALLALYAGSFGVALWTGSRHGVLPRSLEVPDLALLGVATHRLSRLLTRDRITTPLRMAFTRYESTDGGGEVHEHSRGRGWRKALGGLLTCPFCAGPWIAGVLTTAFVLRPRETRLVASVLVMVTISDFTHQAYAFARKAS
jgi:hypothetical protein